MKILLLSQEIEILQDYIGTCQFSVEGNQSDLIGHILLLGIGFWIRSPLFVEQNSMRCTVQSCVRDWIEALSLCVYLISYSKPDLNSIELLLLL